MEYTIPLSLFLYIYVCVVDYTQTTYSMENV